MAMINSRQSRLPTQDRLGTLNRFSKTLLVDPVPSPASFSGTVSNTTGKRLVVYCACCEIASRQRSNHEQFSEE